MKKEEQNVCIREAGLEDIEDIVRIMEAASEACANQDWFVADDVKMIEAHIEKEGKIFLACVDGEKAGFFIVRFPGMAEDNLGKDIGITSLNKVAHMESTAVLPKFRGRKLMRQLLGSAEEAAVQRGFRYLCATVHPDNTPSLHNFEKAGFQIVKRMKKYGGKERYIVYKEG